MAPHSSPARFLDLFVNSAGFLALLAIAIFSTRPPLYDEPHRLEVVAVWQQHGLSRGFLQEMPHATGPLTPIMQAALAPLTHLRPPGIRLTNVVLLAAIIALTAATLRRRETPAVWENAIAVMALPTTWVVAGLALTEIPAMACAATAIFALSALRDDSSNARLWKMLCAAAPGIALAALGRQPFLLLACALPLAAWNRPARWPPFLVAAALGLVPIAVVFTIWGGATPPSVRWVGAGLAPKHAILAFAYAGAFTLLFAPGWLVREWRFAWLLAAAFMLSMAIGAVELLPMATVAQQFLSPALLVVARRAIGSLFVALAVWFVVTLGRRAWAERGDGFVVYASAGVFLLLLSTLKITGNFSSRYVAMTFPLLLPLLAPSREPGSLSAPCRSLLGNALGLASLLSHLGGAAD